MHPKKEFQMKVKRDLDHEEEKLEGRRISTDSTRTIPSKSQYLKRKINEN